MSEEEQGKLAQNERYSGAHSPRLPQHNERPLFSSPSLRRASGDPDAASAQPGLSPTFYDYPTGQQHAPSLPSADATPTPPPRAFFSNLPRPIFIAAWIASVVLAVIVVFVAMSIGGHGGPHGQSSRPSAKAVATSVVQAITSVTTVTTTSGNRPAPATSTPGGIAPTSVPVNAPPPTSAVAPTATIDPNTCTWAETGQASTNSQTVGANTVTVTAHLYWDVNGSGTWCGELETDVLVTTSSSSQLVSGTITSTLSYKTANGSYTSVSASKDPGYSFHFAGLVGDPERTTCGGPGGSFVGSGFDVTAEPTNVCPS